MACQIRMWFLVVALLAVVGVPVAAQAAEDPYHLPETLAAARRFDEAEAEYRRELREWPQDWRLRLGLARVILWDGRYREADHEFAALLAERPSDPNALLGYAQAAYWNGDFRRARRRYERLREVDPGHAEANKVLSDIALLTAPGYEVGATHRDDSQPYRVSMMRAKVSYFSDPLVRWDLIGGVGDVSDGESSMASVGAGVSATFPWLRSTVAASGERFRFPDGFNATVGEVAVTRSLPARSALVVSARCTPLLGTAFSVDDHEMVTQYSISWRRDPAERWLAAHVPPGASIDLIANNPGYAPRPAPGRAGRSCARRAGAGRSGAPG